MRKSEWTTIQAEESWVPWQEIHGKDCLIALVTRPTYCDRGNFIATIDAINCMPLHWDEANQCYRDLMANKPIAVQWPAAAAS